MEKEVFEDDHFKQLLKDAAISKTHGNPWNLETEIGPLAVKISDKTQEAIDHTDDKDWLLRPTVDNGYMQKVLLAIFSFFSTP